MQPEALPRDLGSYRLLEMIGKGSFCKIYKAEAPDPYPKIVALKQVTPKYMYDSDFVQMLRSEAETLTQLSHPNLIHMHGFFMEGAIPFAVMEYVEGPSLLRLYKNALAQQQLLSRPAVLWIAREVCAALAYLHGIGDLSKNIQKLLHTDLSERNILVGRNGDVKLIDFSVEQCALNLEDNVTAGHWGLLQEMSPERLKGETIDVGSDIFQLGLILYQQLTGKHLFEGKVGFWLYQAIREVNVTASSLPEDWNADLKNLLIRSLAREPQDRFDSAKSFAESIGAYLLKTYPQFNQEQLCQDLAPFRNSEKNLPTNL